jgi:hypothetical protein
MIMMSVQMSLVYKIDSTYVWTLVLYMAYNFSDGGFEFYLTTLYQLQCL